MVWAMFGLSGGQLVARGRTFGQREPNNGYEGEDIVMASWFIRKKSGVTRPCRAILGSFSWAGFDVSVPVWVCLGLSWTQCSAILSPITAIKGFISIFECGYHMLVSFFYFGFVF